MVRSLARAGSLVLVLAGEPVSAQEVLPPEPPDVFDEIITEMRFDRPTRIEGRLVTLDTYDDAVWLEWTHVFERGVRRAVPAGRQFLVYAHDREVMARLRRLKPGTVVRMTVLKGEDGKRWVLELEPVPEVPRRPLPRPL